MEIVGEKNVIISALEKTGGAHSWVFTGALEFIRAQVLYVHISVNKMLVQ